MKAFGELLGDSPGMRAVREKIARLLQRPAESRRLPPILIQGETGTGKGLLARLIHRAGPRPDGPFVDVNCAAIPETLLEAEMFGFERGAFTDARRSKPGLFQAAHRGTIFLDEVGLLPEALQAKLLKVLEERTVRRLGATRDEPVDVWIVTATNEDLQTAIRARRFREDLYHRLAVLTVALPPLRERGDDIVALAEYFLGRVCADYGVPRKTLSPEAVEALRCHPWPGNVRELSNVIERAVLLSPSSELTSAALGLSEVRVSAGSDPGPATTARAPGTVSLDDAMRGHLLEVLGQTGWNISRTAALLGISRNTLRARMDKYGLRDTDRAARPAPIRGSAAAPSADSSTPVVERVPRTLSVRLGLTRRWERRPVAFLCAALAPSAGGAASLEATRALEVIVDKTRTFGGTIEGIGPIGLVAGFGLDVVGDAAERAAHAAMAILNAAERARREDDSAIGVRVGLHVTTVLVGLAAGHADVDMDDRRHLWPVLDELLERVPLQSIVVTASAAAFLRRRFELTAGPGVIVGGRERTYVLVGRQRTALEVAAPATVFVGRGHELDLLESRVTAAARGQGQIIGIAGDAGIGKSRLLAELRRRLTDESITWLDGHCQSYGAAIPYLPLVDLLRTQCGIGEHDQPDVVADKLVRALREVGMDPARATPYLLHLLVQNDGGDDALSMLSAETIRARTFDALRELHLRRAHLSPLVILIEDLHWVDGTSEEYLTSLVDAVPGAPILLVTTYRSGYRPPWIERSSATQLALQPLAPDESLRLVRAGLGLADGADQLASLVVARSEGNPFFIEELVRVAGDQDGISTGSLPETLQDVVLARIDRLPPEARRVLQSAAVIGSEVPLSLLEHLTATPGGLDGLLAHLAAQQFLYARSAGEERTVVFRHALTQEVAYTSLSSSERGAMHAAVAQALESVYRDRLDDAVDRLAHHYARTAEHGKAVHYLSLSADRAAGRHAHREAMAALRAARERAEQLPAGRSREARVLDLVIREATSLHLLGGLDEALRLLLAHSTRVEQLGDPAVAGPYYFWLARSYSRLGDHARTAPNIRLAIDHARACKDDATLGRAYFLLAYEEYSSGHPRQAVEHARTAATLLERTPEAWWLGMAHWMEAVSATLMGDLVAARTAATRADAIGIARQDPHLQNYAAWTTAWIDTLRGEWPAAIHACENALRSSTDPINTAFATGQLGHAHLERGDAAGAIPLLEQASARLGELGVRPTQSRFLAWLSEAYLADGAPERAEALARRALVVSGEAAFPYGMALAERALGMAIAGQGRRDEAGVHLEQALGMFEVMPAVFESARTRLALAELALASGRAAEGTQHAGQAASTFEALGAPIYVARARRLAGDDGMGA